MWCTRLNIQAIQTDETNNWFSLKLGEWDWNLWSRDDFFVLPKI